MQVIKRSESGYTQDPTKYFNFSRFTEKVGDYVLIEGAFEQATLWDQFSFTKKELDEILQKKIIRLEFEEPNKFFIGDDPNTYDHQFYKIYTLCPYTTEWLNKKQKAPHRRQPIFFPFNEEYIPKPVKKISDIVYTGHIVSNKLMNDLETMTHFNYRFVSNSKHPWVTNHSASYEEKMQLIAQSKITLVQNLLYPKPYHILFIWKISDYHKNEAFKLIPPRTQPWRIFTDKNIVVPQLKSRVFEAAFGRSLILCKHDPFNIIERYFEPNKEFVYYEEGKLDEKINEILHNYKKYEVVIERAFNRAKKDYTTSAFVKNYLEKLP